MRISVIIPTRNASAQISGVLAALKRQTEPVHEMIVVDSASEDDTVTLARQEGAQVLEIPHASFDHGGTRDMAVRACTGEFILFLTQDAIPANEQYVKHLLAPFADSQIGAASGRQLPRPDARAYVKLIQNYRYPPQSRTWGMSDVEDLGLRGFHLSDVCAAYRKEAYLATGGFPHPLRTNEDMLMASMLLRQGYRLAYCAEAKVVHSHSFSLRQEYQRNFEIGRFLQVYGSAFGKKGEIGEGLRMVRTVMQQLLQQSRPLECVPFALNCAARYLGNRRGRSAAARR